MTVGIKDNKRTTSRFLHKRGHVTDAQPPPTRVNDGWSTGDTRVMYVWDAHTETQLIDLSTREESPVTTLASESGPSATVLAGFADGAVKVFDRRMDEDNAVVRAYNDHYGWVQNVRWHPHLPGQFLSARCVICAL